MNKLMITIATTLLLTTAGMALAQDDSAGMHERKGDRQQRGMQATPGVEKMMRAIRHLDLSAEQRESFTAVMQAMKAEMRPIMHDTKAGYLALRELVKADSYDEEAVAAIAEKQGNLAAERVLITSRAMSDIFSQLTVEQRAELDAMAEKRQARRGERRQQRTAES